MRAIKAVARASRTMITVTKQCVTIKTTVVDVVSIILVTSSKKPEIATFCRSLPRRRRGCFLSECWIACPTRYAIVIE